MWRLGFLFHEMSFGLLSVFLPLYIFSLSGSLIWVEIMSATAMFLSIPASFFWGYICDRTRRYKSYILTSFLSLASTLCLLTLTTQIILLVTLYTVMALFHVAHEPPKNVLIAELYSHEEWKKAFAFYEGLTEIGWLIGLILGIVTSLFSFDAKSILLLCSSLNLAAFFASFLLIKDPVLIFERSLVTIEKSVGFAYRGVSIFSKIVDGVAVNERLRRENFIFCCGLVLFSLATSILFTPMPIFIANIIDAAALPSRIVLCRSFLTLLLIAATWLSTHSVIIAAAILVLLGFSYTLYLVNILSLSMEIIPKGKAGLFDVSVGIGSASGSFIGSFIAQTYSFAFVFLASFILFLLSYLAFKIFA